MKPPFTCLIGLHAFGAWASHESDGQILGDPTFLNDEPMTAFRALGEHRVCTKCGYAQTRPTQEQRLLDEEESKP